jgi:hypothetical protein
VQLDCEVKLGQPAQSLYIHQLATKGKKEELEVKQLRKILTHNHQWPFILKKERDFKIKQEI